MAGPSEKGPGNGSGERTEGRKDIQGQSRVRGLLPIGHVHEAGCAVLLWPGWEWDEALLEVASVRREERSATIVVHEGQHPSTAESARSPHYHTWKNNATPFL